jgi:uncharacterized caspase-like protein
MLRTFLFAFAVAVVLPAVASAERRAALVFGVDEYRVVRPLQNAVNDARTIETTLRSLGFEVFTETNRDLRRMRRALEDLQEDAAGAEVVLVFFAGHGVEVLGENRLLPVDADTSSLDALKQTSLPLVEVTETVKAIAPIAIVLLDACRNDPFGSTNAQGRGANSLLPKMVTDSVKPGLGRVGPAENVLVAFAAAPGKTAADGDAANSPFTAALANHLGSEGLQVGSALKLVQQDVYDRSRGKQLPFIEDGLPELFFAAATVEVLPERERLLLAMAGISSGLREEVESIAAQRNMPLAPLYAALIGVGAGDLSADERFKRLTEAADAFVSQRDELRTLSAEDPDVARLRVEAEEQLALGAYQSARMLIDQAIRLDLEAARTLESRAAERDFSAAATHFINGGMALSALRYTDAVTDYEAAAGIYERYAGNELLDDHLKRYLLSLEALGNIHLTLGRLAEAKVAFMRQVEVSEAASKMTSGQAESSLISSLTKMGDVSIAEGNADDGIQYYNKSAALIDALLQEAPNDAEWLRAGSVLHNRIGDAAFAHGDLSAAEKAYRSALTMRQPMASNSTASSDALFAVAVSHSKIGEVLLQADSPTGALDSLDSALEIVSDLLSHTPNNAEWLRAQSVVFEKIGRAKYRLNDPSGTTQAYDAALAVANSLLEQAPDNTTWQRDVAVINARLAEAHGAMGAVSQALIYIEKSVEISSQLTALDPDNAQWQSDLEQGYRRLVQLGNIAGQIGDAQAMILAYTSSHQVLERLVSKNSGGWRKDLHISHGRIGDALLSAGDVRGALVSYQASIHVLLDRLASDENNSELNWDLFVAHVRLANVATDQVEILTAALGFADQIVEPTPDQLEYVNQVREFLGLPHK